MPPDAARASALSYAVLGLALLLLAARAVGLHLDAPAVTISGSLLTDEGWWAKGAYLWARTGHPTAPLDSNFWPVAPLYSATLAAVFAIFGDTPLAARGLALVSFYAGALAFLWTLRRALPPLGLAAAALALALSPFSFALSRVALIESFSTALSLIALALWITHGGGRARVALSLLVAVLAFWSKLAFAHAFAAVWALWVLEALNPARPLVERRFILGGLGLSAIVVIGSGIALLSLDAADHARGYLGTGHFGQREKFSLLLNIPQTFAMAGFGTGMMVWYLLLPAGIAVLLALAWRAARPGGGPIDWLTRLREMALANRAATAWIVWLAVGLTIVGINLYRPPRYFHFTLYPTIALTLLLLWRLGGARLFPVLALAFALTVPLGPLARPMARWLAEPRDTLLTDMGVLATAILADGGRTLVMGSGIANLLTLVEPRIGSVELETEIAPLCARVAAHRPGYVLHQRDYRGEDPRLDLLCPDLVTGRREVARVNPMDDYAGYGPIIVERVLYRPPQ